MHTRNLIVGCGLSGAVLARVLAEAGQQVLVVDERDHIGGNIFDYRDEHGITVQKYGPHVFHTSDEHVWTFLSRFTAWRPLVYRVRALVDGREIDLPVGLRSLGQLYAPAEAEQLRRKLVQAHGLGTRVSILALRQSADPALAALAADLFAKIYAGYTRKQWGLPPEALDAAVLDRVPVAVSYDEGYFADKYSAVPAAGYTALVRNLVAHPGIAVETGAPYEEVRHRVTCDTLFYSGSIDSFFGYRHGALPYRAADYELRTFDREFHQSCPQINYPNDHAYTRTVEHKYFLGERSPRTVVTFEHPQPFRPGVNHRSYPIPRPDSADLYRRYQAEAAAHPGIVFFGRLGDYRYYNMDAAVARALRLGATHS